MGPALSVLIPTRNRAALLEECLHTLFTQDYPPDQWEIVVVDDGSMDATPSVLKTLEKESPVPLRAFPNPGRGVAAARNEAIRKACGELLLMTGDDILLSGSWVRAHAESHRSTPDTVAVLGHTDWDPRLGRTPILEYLDQGKQFGYRKIDDPENVKYLFFYTSNLSFKKGFLLRTGELFDESYPFAAMEDIDLGYRLSRHGLRIRYVKEAKAHHYHPVTWKDFLRRAHVVGQSSALFYSKFPELKTKGIGQRLLYGPWKRCLYGLLRPLLECVGYRPLLFRCYDVFFDYHRFLGYQAAKAR